jgi:hypothetical protein
MYRIYVEISRPPSSHLTNPARLPVTSSRCSHRSPRRTISRDPPSTSPPTPRHGSSITGESVRAVGPKQPALAASTRVRHAALLNTQPALQPRSTGVGFGGPKSAALLLRRGGLLVCVSDYIDTWFLVPALGSKGLESGSFIWLEEIRTIRFGMARLYVWFATLGTV